MRFLAALLLFPALPLAAADLARSLRAPHDAPLSADPASPFWTAAPGVRAGNDSFGRPVPGHETEIRSRWTAANLYFLFVCPYEELFLKPEPPAAAETNFLWRWDVAEVFIGADFSNIKRYREFQVSPRGEWVDLDIDRDQPDPAREGVLWNSGFAVKARIDEARKVWCGEMRIPISSIDTRPARAGNQFRVNFYRLQGPGPKRKGIAWRPTHQPSYHVPEAFGRLILED